MLRTRQVDNFSFRPATLGDEADIVRLNAASVVATSPMDAARFRMLFKLCRVVTVAETDDRVVGFLMGLTDGTDYDSVNYRWFAERLKQFFYVDRIVISKECRGLGVGTEFYAHAESWAIGAGLLWLAAEMYLDPPNTTSLSFHEKQGFAQIGTQQLESGKVVSLQIRPVA